MTVSYTMKVVSGARKMKKNTSALILLTILLALVVIGVQVLPLEAAGRGCGGSGSGGGGGGCGGGGSGTVPLSEYEKQSLYVAIDEEYKAKAIYQKVVYTFGSIEPFSWIIRDEQCHVNWVANLLTRYGLPVPPDNWSGNIALEFASKQQACEIGAQAEFDNAAVYDTMIPKVSHDDIASVFARLRDVSRYRHLPAFQNWANIYASSGE